MTTSAKILIIDDNQFDRDLTRLMLTKSGFEVTELNRAATCLEVIRTEKPNLILLDIMMPDMNGNQALQMIREKYSEIELPIIMVTSKIDASDVIESLILGANDYITKPIKFDVALRRIQTHLAIGMQSALIAKAKELEAIHAMITTFNHEVNNPLFIAFGLVKSLKAQNQTDPRIPKLEIALERIAEVVKKTDQILGQSSLKYEEYSKTIKMISLK